MPIAGYTGDSTFRGVAFLAEETGPLARRAPSRVARTAIRQAPWGSRVVVQVLGNEPARLQYRITIYSTAYTTLAGYVGTSGALAIVGDASRSDVLLESLDDVTVDDANGLTFCTATFIVAQ